MQKLGLGQLHPVMDRELDKLQQLTLDEQMALLEKAKAGDIEARNKLIDSVLPLVRYILHKHYRHDDIEEAMQEASVYLTMAIAKYDGERSALQTYVRLCVHRALSRLWARKGSSSRSGDTFGLDGEDMDRAANAAALTWELWSVDISKLEHGSESIDIYAMDLRQKLSSAIDAMESAKIPSVGSNARVRAARVLRMVYGLNGGLPMTHPEVAEVIGCTPQMVSLDKQFGLAQLRKMPQVRALLVYLGRD